VTIFHDDEEVSKVLKAIMSFEDEWVIDGGEYLFFCEKVWV